MNDKPKNGEQPNAAEKPDAGGRARGPSFPMWDLAEALRRTGIIYENEKLASVNAGVAMTHIGLSITSSSGLRALAALLSYGLLQDEGRGDSKRVRVSENARILLRHPDKASSEYRAAMRAVALAPKIHKEVFEKFKDGLPTPAALQWELEQQWGYNVGALGDLDAEIRATFGLANVYMVDRLGEGSAKTPMTEAASEAPVAAPASGAAALQAREPPMPPAVAIAPAAEARQQQEALDIPIPLISGGRATLRLPIPMSEGDYVLLRAMLLANLDGLKEAIVRKPGAPVPPSQP